MPLAMPAAARKPIAERHPAAILLCELRGFARGSESLQPVLALQLASRFFTLAAMAIQAETGEVLSVRNESLFAAFRGGDAAQTAVRALRAALRVQREAGLLAEGWRQTHGLRAAASVALHLGDALFGRIGPEGMEQPTALGDCVSVAERLLGRARAGEFVLSHEVLKVVSPESLDLDAEPLPPLELPRREPVRLYGVLLAERLDFTS